MNLNNLKGINAVWLSETDLTNLNAGEGESNYIDVKKYKKAGTEYPYVSGQAMRFYLKEAIRRELGDDEYMCVPDAKGETCGEVEKCILCDLFGFMTTRPKEAGRKGGAITRVSPVKVAPAMGFLPFDENSNVDFLTRKHRMEEEEKMEGDIVNVEIGENIYKSGVSIDLVRIGAKEKVEEAREINFEDKIDEEEKKNRIIKALEAIKSISDYSKQARLLTDFTPDLIIISMQGKYTHRLQKALRLEMNEEREIIKKVDTKRLDQILKEVEEYSDEIFAGMITGIFENEEEIKSTLEEHRVEVLTPAGAIDKVVVKLE